MGEFVDKLRAVAADARQRKAEEKAQYDRSRKLQLAKEKREARSEGARQAKVGLPKFMEDAAEEGSDFVCVILYDIRGEELVGYKKAAKELAKKLGVNCTFDESQSDIQVRLWWGDKDPGEFAIPINQVEMDDDTFYKMCYGN